MWSEESVPKIISHSSQAIPGPSCPPNSAFQANPTAPAVLPHHHPEFGSGEGENKPKAQQTFQSFQVKDWPREGLGELGTSLELPAQTPQESGAAGVLEKRF